MKPLFNWVLILCSPALLCAAESTVDFSERAGFLEKPTDVVLRTTLQDAVIRFSTNGSVPNQASAIYEKPLKVSSRTLIRAASFQDGVQKGESVTRTYLF